MILQMDRRPDREKAEVLSEKDLKELRYLQPRSPQRVSGSGILRAGLSGLPIGLQPASESTKDPNACQVWKQLHKWR